MTLTPEDKQQVFRQLDKTEGHVLGLAVSGGGDSMALAALAVEWARKRNRKVATVTIDHGLRAESAGEAARVATFSGELGVPHQTLNWGQWDGSGNLQDAARRARAGLVEDWARQNGVTSVATGHTLDDQAETVLMRLARGSSVDGLSAMAPSRRADFMTWHRPLLTITRQHLRDYLAAEGLPWIDDPSNDDLTFDRVKARRALEILAPMGIDRAGLAETATRMQRARAALEYSCSTLAKDAVRIDRGDLLMDWGKISSAPEEIRNRIVASGLMWVSGAEYRPRASGLDGAIAALENARTTVLSGCQISSEGTMRRVTRELSAVSSTVSDIEQPWDGRWLLSGPTTPNLQVRALGDAGVRACPDWRESGLPRASLIASPSVWRTDRLIAAPLAGFGRGWSANLVPTRSLFQGVNEV